MERGCFFDTEIVLKAAVVKWIHQSPVTQGSLVRASDTTVCRMRLSAVAPSPEKIQNKYTDPLPVSIRVSSPGGVRGGGGYSDFIFIHRLRTSI